MNRHKRGALAGVVSLALAVLVAAFGSAAASASAPSGTLSWDPLDGMTSTWDPPLVSAGGYNFQLALVYDSLTRLEPDGSAGPDLATSWKFINKGLTLQMTLRRGVKFTDGTIFNANAVKLNLQRSQTITGSASAADLAPIKSIQVVGPYSVRLHLSQPAYDLPLILGFKDGMIVSPKALANSNGAALSTTADGSGPFILTGFVANGYATFKRNPHYWDAGDIHLAGVRLDASADPSVALAGLRSGQFQLAGTSSASFPAVDVSAAKANGLAVDVFPTIGQSDVAVNTNVKPFNNPLLVEALNYATNRSALVKTVNAGLGKPTSEVFPAGYVAYNDDAVNLYPYNVAKAKKLLAQAGYPNGVQITLDTSAIQNFPAVAELLQSQWAAAGITATIQTLTLPALSAATLAGTVGLSVSSLVARASPVQALLAFYGPGSALNPCHCINPALTKALAKLAPVPSTSSKYSTVLQAATLTASKNGPNIILDTLPSIFPHTKKLKGLQSWVVYPRLEGVSLR
jgi:peptide/nickel transport system substrate-binding protein